MTDTILWYDINVVTVCYVVMELDHHCFDLMTSVGIITHVFVMA